MSEELKKRVLGAHKKLGTSRIDDLIHIVQHDVDSTRSLLFERIPLDADQKDQIRSLLNRHLALIEKQVKVAYERGLGIQSDIEEEIEREEG